MKDVVEKCTGTVETGDSCKEHDVVKKKPLIVRIGNDVVNEIHTSVGDFKDEHPVAAKRIKCAVKIGVCAGAGLVLLAVGAALAGGHDGKNELKNDINNTDQDILSTDPVTVDVAVEEVQENNEPEIVEVIEF